MPRANREEKKIVPFFVLVIPLIFIADRISKTIILSRYAEGEGLAVVPGVFHITRVSNTGAAFGLWKGSSLFLIFVSFVCVCALGFYLWTLRPQKGQEKVSFLAQLPWALVSAGALGNLYDRIQYGYVIDFLDFRVWPVFNIADISITLGVFWVFLNYFKGLKSK